MIGANISLFQIPVREVNKRYTFIIIIIDKSVLLENTPLIKFVRNYIQNPSDVFSIHH